MSLRPVAAHWFEMVTVRKDLARAVECLSRTGAVELEAKVEDTGHLVLPDLGLRLKAWQELARRYHTHWPSPRLNDHHPHEPAEALDGAMDRVTAWRGDADRVIDRLEALLAEQRALRSLDEALRHANADDLPPLDLLTAASSRLAARLLSFPERSLPRDLPPLLLQHIVAAGTRYILAVGRSADVAEFEALASGLGGSNVPLPTWLPASKPAAQAAIAERLRHLADESGRLEQQLQTLSDQHDLAVAIGEITLIEWLSQHSAELRASERLVWVTGWTSDRHGHDLRRSLEAAQVHALVRLSEAPRGRIAPMLLDNPPAVRGFEVLTRMLGTPSQSEVDPSTLLSIIAPLLFGFMFGDVGQGLVIAAAGLYFRQRAPFLAILVPGGLAAAGFGVLFGSVFAREDVIPALWMHPLSQPLTLLAITVGAGAVLLSIGLLLDCLQAHWRGEGRIWWRSRAGLAVAFSGVLAASFAPPALWLLLAGAVWFIAGTALAHGGARHFVAAAGIAAAEFVEQGIQLVINTVSFARVGAFTLAHAGLSAAVTGVAEVAGGAGYWIILILGNVLIIALEGLVVGIQTTRLVLFEFFVRFFQAKGRQFKPLSPPDMVAAGGRQTLN